MLRRGSAQAWLAHAQSDLDCARLGLTQAEVLAQDVCFHAQSAVEKALKAVLLARRVEFPRTHDIEELLEIIRASGGGLPLLLESPGALTPYAVATHYPGAWGSISEANVDEAIHLAAETLDWARAAMEVQAQNE